MDAREVLLRHVSALVTETADITLFENDSPDEHEKIEVDLYRYLAVNCERKARETEAFLASLRGTGGLNDHRVRSGLHRRTDLDAQHAALSECERNDNEVIRHGRSGI